MTNSPVTPGARLLTPAVLGILAFNAMYVLAAGVVAMQGKNHEFLLYVAVLVVIGAGIGWMHSRVGLSIGLLWALSFWGLAHMLGGLCPVPESWPINGEQRVLYSLWLIPERLKYDQVVHAYGFAITTWTCWQGLRSVLGPQARPSAGLLLLCAAGGMGFGALNEVIEFVATLTMPSTNVGGYENTGWDLVANLVGCVIAAVILRVTYRAPSTP